MDRIIKIRSIAIAVLLISIAVFISGCSKEINQEDIIGKFTANHDQGIDTLEIRTDGTYIHEFKSNEKSFINTDKWEFEKNDGKPVLTLSGFIAGFSDYGPKEPGFLYLAVERRVFSNIKLYINIDMGRYYEKDV